MKKLWRNYSYAIILVILSSIGVFTFSYIFPSSTDEYKKITVSEGETLWKISEKYSDYHDLSKIEFVEWVERYNGISGDHIFAGDELTIPIKNSPIELEKINNLASNE